MPCVDDDGYPFGFDGLGYCVCYLLCELLLYLESSCEDIDDTGDFGESYDFAIGDISDMDTPDDRENVVFAHGVKLDVSHHHHLIVATAKKGLTEYLLGVLCVPFGEELK